jgi:hypothetical protein
VELTPRPLRLLVEASTVTKTEELPAFKAGILLTMAGFPPDPRKTPKGEVTTDVPVEPLRIPTDEVSNRVLGKEEKAANGPRLDSAGNEVERGGGISLVSISTDSERMVDSIGVNNPGENETTVYEETVEWSGGVCNCVAGSTTSSSIPRPNS